MTELRKFIGCPFKDKGRGSIDRKHRRPVYDCYGLFLSLFKHFGYDLPDFDISCFATRDIYRKYVEQVGEWERLDEPEVPCAVVLAVDDKHPNIINHVGVYVGDGKFIHTLESTGSIVSHTYDILWKTKIKGYYRWKKS
jgi:cell wall-associated NlpC family hydrolase